MSCGRLTDDALASLRRSLCCAVVDSARVLPLVAEVEHSRRLIPQLAERLGILSLLTTRLVEKMRPPAGDDPWDERERVGP